MSLAIDVAHGFGAFRLEAAFTVGGGVTALFGPSGSGKTSLVRIVAGLLRPDRGRVAVDGRVLVDTERRIAVPAHRRRVGYVFQEPRLFPHLSVRQNLTFGRWFTPRSEPKPDMAGIVELLGIGHLLARRPASLSGGEKSRVAIGRALLSSPRLLLLDEPLANLDEARRAEILPYLERLRDAAGMPILFVSHAVGEVARLANNVVLLENGRVVSVGPTAAILRRPGSAAEASAVIAGRVAAHDARFGLATLDTAAGPLRVPHPPLAPGIAVRVHIKARDVMLATERPAGISALNVMDGRVLAITEADDASALVELACGSETLTARITRLSAAELSLEPGRPVYAIIKGVALETGARGGAPAPVEA
jgi:molybdate transport system ATP-binding protein